MLLSVVIHTLVLAGAVYFLRPRRSVGIYWMGITARVCASMIIGGYYLLYIEEGDTIIFHHQALDLYHTALSDFSSYCRELGTWDIPIYESTFRNQLFVRILSIIYIFTQGNYWISSIYLSLISFTSSWYLYLCLSSAHPKLAPVFACSILFIPSVLIWSSGILKDTLTSVCICYLASVLVQHFTIREAKKLHWIMTFLLLTLLFYLKFYLAVAVLFTFTLGVCYQFSLLLQTQGRWVMAVACLAAIVALSYLNYNLRPTQISHAVYANYKEIYKSSDHHQIHFPQLDGSIKSMVISLPLSLWTGLFRPHPWEADRWLCIPALEHLALWMLSLTSLLKIKSAKWTPLPILALAFVLLLSSLLPMTSPNFGSLVRYQAAYLPFAFLLSSILPYQWLMAIFADRKKQ